MRAMVDPTVPTMASRDDRHAPDQAPSPIGGELDAGSLELEEHHLAKEVEVEIGAPVHGLHGYPSAGTQG